MCSGIKNRKYLIWLISKMNMENRKFNKILDYHIVFENK